MKIRKARLNDINSLANIHSLSWKEAYKNIFSEKFLKNLRTEIFLENRKKKFRRDIEENSMLDFFIIEFSEKAIGILILSSLQKITKDKNVAEIIAIYLLPEFWNSGFGKEILSFSIARAKDFGAKKIFLWVVVENKRARKFYEKNGFVVTGRKKILPIENKEEMEYMLDIK